MLCCTDVGKTQHGRLLQVSQKTISLFNGLVSPYRVNAIKPKHVFSPRTILYFKCLPTQLVMMVLRRAGEHGSDAGTLFLNSTQNE